MDSLSLLLEVAVKQYKPVGKKDPKAMKDARGASLRPLVSTYQKPENWTETKLVTLIHKGEFAEETLLGNFQEYIHKDGARKLVRITSPSVSEFVERVTGNWWLNPFQENSHSSPKDAHWYHTYNLVAGVTLKELILHSPEVSVKVTTYFSSLMKVELEEETRFFNLDRTTFLMLHRGTDILGCLDLDSKMALSAQLDELKNDVEGGV